MSAPDGPGSHDPRFFSELSRREKTIDDLMKGIFLKVFDGDKKSESRHEDLFDFFDCLKSLMRHKLTQAYLLSSSVGELMWKVTEKYTKYPLFKNLRRERYRENDHWFHNVGTMNDYKQLVVSYAVCPGDALRYAAEAVAVIPAGTWDVETLQLRLDDIKEVCANLKAQTGVGAYSLETVITDFTRLAHPRIGAKLSLMLPKWKALSDEVRWGNVLTEARRKEVAIDTNDVVGKSPTKPKSPPRPLTQQRVTSDRFGSSGRTRFRVSSRSPSRRPEAVNKALVSSTPTTLSISDRPPRNCFECGSPDHIRRDCP